MIETNIGQVTLSLNQIARLSTLHDNNIHGFFIDSRGVLVKSDTPINVSAVTAALSSLDNSPSIQASDKTEFGTSVFKNLTPQQADDYIATNVTTIATAKLAMQKMARVLIYLLRRSDL